MVNVVSVVVVVVNVVSVVVEVVNVKYTTKANGSDKCVVVRIA